MSKCTKEYKKQGNTIIRYFIWILFVGPEGVWVKEDCAVVLVEADDGNESFALFRLCLPFSNNSFVRLS
eukprot:m.150112 g.150112  ORF g.150112 m.150112 type:complete len:69 (+) comp13279_c1_seq3:835-1041(+)